MFDALTYQEMLKEIKKNSEKYGITNDMVAIFNNETRFSDRKGYTE